MKTRNTSNKLHRLALAVTCFLAGAVVPAYAGEGHDHGEASAVTNANGPQRMADGSVFCPSRPNANSVSELWWWRRPTCRAPLNSMGGS